MGHEHRRASPRGGLSHLHEAEPARRLSSAVAWDAAYPGGARRTRAGAAGRPARPDGADCVPAARGCVMMREPVYTMATGRIDDVVRLLVRHLHRCTGTVTMLRAADQQWPDMALHEFIKALSLAEDIVMHRRGHA